MNYLMVGIKIYWIWFLAIDIACILALDSIFLIGILYIVLSPLMFYLAGLVSKRFDFYFMNLNKKPSILFLKLMGINLIVLLPIIFLGRSLIKFYA